MAARKAKDTGAATDDRPGDTLGTAEGAAAADAPQEGAAKAEGGTTPSADPLPQDERRLATVISRIAHDGQDYRRDEEILLTRAEFEALRATGALAEADWDACTPAE